MDNFIVSARKYRPQLFDTVVGQQHITNTLKNAILTKQLAQAYLFCGPRGVGKTTCARIFAKTINCTGELKHGEACDTCESCQSFNSGASLNVYELDAASNNSVEDIRNLVDQVRFAPQLGEYKVYIIDEVHMLSMSAFNAFLKTLEEPPKHAKFILATTEKHKIIPTILSRCQVFNFNRIKTEDISKHLAYMANNEHVSFEPDALRVIAQKAEGGLRDACSIFDQMVAFTGNQLTYKSVVENLNVLDNDYYFKLVDFFLSQNLSEVMLTFDTILRKGFDAHHFIIGLGEHMRNLLVSLDPQTTALIETSENLKQKYAEQARQCQATMLMKGLALISKTDLSYKGAKNQRLLIEVALMQLTYLTATPDAEKKNDELIPAAQQKAATTSNKAAENKITALAEPGPKFADKPSVPFEQLKIKSAFSLNEIHRQAPVAPSPNTTTVKVVETLQDKEIGLSDIKAFIDNYILKKQKLGARQIATIFKTAGVEFNNHTLELTIHNETQREQLMAMRQEFLDEMRLTLQNQKVNLNILLTEQTQEVKAYKPLDIFKAMAERNPSLLELKKRFDLEIDY